MNFTKENHWFCNGCQVWWGYTGLPKIWNRRWWNDEAFYRTLPTLHSIEDSIEGDDM